VPQSIKGVTNGVINLSSSNLAPGRYTAQFSVSSSNYNTAGTTDFYVIQPAKLLITNFTVQPNSTTLGSPISLIQTMSNLGGLIAENPTLNIGISGPNTFFDFIHQKLDEIEPNGIQTITTQLVGDSAVAGIYTINENVSFSSNLTVNNVTYSSGRLFSNAQKGSYTVIYDKSSSYNFSSGLPVPPISIENISIISMPVYTAVLIGNTTTSYLGMENTASYTTHVTIEASNISYGKLIASTKAFTLTNGDSEYVQFVFTPYLNASPGIYTEPLNITTYKGFNATANGTSSVIYLVLNIEQKKKAALESDLQETLTNHNNIGGSMNIYNPTNTTINSTVVSLKFPSFALQASTLSLTGAETNIATSGGNTSLEWLLPSIQPGHSVQLGYSISNIIDTQLLLEPATNIASKSGATAPIFTLINSTSANLTVGTNGTLKITGLYQGVHQSALTLSLSSNSTNVKNSEELVKNVGQEQIISTTFTIVPNTITTTVLKLGIKGQNINESYYIPVQVSPKSTLLSRFVKAVESDILYIAATVIAIVLLIAALQLVTTELPKAIVIEKAGESTSNKEMRKNNYDHLFQILSEVDENSRIIDLKGIPMKWGLLTPINKRDVRVINASGNLTIYTSGPARNSIKRYLKDKKIPFVELPVK
jgi:hypothetical protein